MRAWVAVTCWGLGIATLGCQPPIPVTYGCITDDECTDREQCTAGNCTPRPPGAPSDAGEPVDAALPDAASPDANGGTDAGPAVVDGGPIVEPPLDAGLPPADAGGPAACVPDALENQTPGTAYRTIPDLSDGRSIEGRLCPGADAYFGFFGFSGDAIQVLARWDGPQDLDIALYDTDGNETPTGLSIDPQLEMSTATLTTTGDQGVKLYPVTPVPASGVGYEVQIRSGLPCRTESDCVPEADCLMPLWTPADASGTPPPGEAIFAGGACVPPYRTSGLADNLSVEGASDSRESTYMVTEAVDVWSAPLDEDWFRFSMGGTGDLVIQFTNRSDMPGTYVLTAFDLAGNMLAGAAYTGLPFDTLRTLTVPYLKVDTVVFVRVFQLGDDELAQYSLQANYVAASCSATDCEAVGARRYGRTQCRSGACECPVPDACTPPGS